MLLEARDLRKRYARGDVPAVDGVSFGIEPGEILGIVGESGCGKSTILKIILRLVEEDAGSVIFEGVPVTGRAPRGLKRLREKTQVVFQDALMSLDPRWQVRTVLEESFVLNGHKRTFHLESRLHDLMKTVSLPLDYLEKYPRQLSGGECQRVAIARALSLEPDLLVCDEPVSSLDVLVRAQILNLMLKLHRERKMSVLIVSHDLRVIRHLCDRVLVMKKGRIVESGPTKDVYNNPRDPYTKELINASFYRIT